MTICAVCHRGLSNPRSVSRGTGPVCDRHVNEFIQHTMVSEMAERARASWTRTRGQMIGVRDQAIRAARSRFLSRLRAGTREVPVETGSVDLGDADPRRRTTSEITFERFDSGAVMAHSGSDEDYLVVTNETGRESLGCSCASFIYHRGREAGTPCRHMNAYDALADARRGGAGAQEAVSRHNAASDQSLEVAHRIEQAPNLLRRIVDEEVTIDRERDEALRAWHERHEHDGVLMSQDDAAWAQLQEEAQASIGHFETDDVLDGSGNTFGVELEVEFENGTDIDAVLRTLHAEGITWISGVTGYHSQGREGFWTPQRDGSLRNGIEFVSPVLRDEPREWERIQRMMQILNDTHGLKRSDTNGLHIHMGNTPLDDRGYRWQRLARYASGYSEEYYRMGGARRSDGSDGLHRGSHYAKPLNVTNLQKISKSDTAMDASRKLVGANARYPYGNRYYMLSTAKMVNSHVPTVEFRYPNATYDVNVLQRQVQLANLTMQQSAYLRKGMLGADRLPKLYSHDESVQIDEDPMRRFRQYLDTLGSDRLRKIATRLWVRGR